MATFERGFAAVEAAAEQAEQAARNLATTARKLRKAAQEGTLSKMRLESGHLADRLTEVDERVREATSSWPFPEFLEADYLNERYAQELCEEAATINLSLSVRDDALVCSPSIIRLLPGDRAVRIDGKKRTAIRPSKLAYDLQSIQHRIKPKSEPQQRSFLEALYRAFRVINGSYPERSRGPGSLVLLADVYLVFTSLPGTSRLYTKTDFARDIYLLDSSGVTTAKNGARVSFPASTGARSASKVFSFVDRNGNVIRYYGIQFTE